MNAHFPIKRSEAYAVLLLAFSSIVMAAFTPSVSAQASLTGRLVLGQGSQSWEQYVWRPSVLFQPSTQPNYPNSIFMMWYSGQSLGGVSNIGLAISSDGLVWARYGQNPVLTVGSPGQWDSGSVQEPWVIRDGGIYKMWYTGEQLSGTGTVSSSAIGYATSPDGLTWTKFSKNPVYTPGLQGSWDDRWVFRPSIIATGVSYTLYYLAQSRQDDTVRIGMAVSPNETDWTRFTTPISISPASWASYSNSIGSVYKLADQYVAFMYGSNSATAPTQIGFAKSPDGSSWTQYPASLFRSGKPGSWDDLGDSLPNMVSIGSNYYIYYTGYQSHGGSQIGLSIIPNTAYPIPEFPTAPLLFVVTIAIALTLLRKRRMKLGIC